MFVHIFTILFDMLIPVNTYRSMLVETVLAALQFP